MVSMITEKLQNTVINDLSRWKGPIFNDAHALPKENTRNTHMPKTIIISDQKLSIINHAEEYSGEALNNNQTEKPKGEMVKTCPSIEVAGTAISQQSLPYPRNTDLTETHVTLQTPPACPHSPIPQQKCLQCDALPNPPAPPKKRHCRSLSIPMKSPDAQSFNKCLGHTSGLHKPVPLRPQSNNNKHSFRNLNRNSPVCSRGFSRYSPVSNNRGSTLSLPGAFPTSGPWTFKGTDYFNTPPESPIPRPASASSGYYEGSITSTSSAPWFENSPGVSKFDMFKIRSVSMEDSISLNKTCVIAGETQGVCTKGVTSGSMPSMAGTAPSSTPSSPQRHHIPRCRSQPCVMSERRTCGIKRRLDQDRPCLNFAKMTETAFPSGATRTRHKTINIPQQTTKSRTSLKFDCLKTIASSPLDSNLPSNFTTPSAEVTPKSISPLHAELIQQTLKEQTYEDEFEPSFDPPKLLDISANHTQDNNCLCDSGNETPADDEEDHMFTMDHVNNEIDLDEMEKD